MYYMMAVLFNNTVLNKEKNEYIKEIEELDKLDNLELHNLLREKDSNMANHWHTNDRRKILNSLKVFFRKKQAQSSIITNAEKKEIRYNTIILWPYIDKEKLKFKLDLRTDQMVKV